jgi:hypothetical protein
MKRTLIRAVVAVALLAVGWTTGRAQAPFPAPDFEVVIHAPVGETVIECVRGCELFWVERGGPGPGAEPGPTFQFGCKGASVQQCGSGRIGGWITK